MTKEQIIDMLKYIYSEADELYKRSDADKISKEVVRDSSFTIMDYTKQLLKEFGYEVTEEDGFIGYF